MIIQILLLSQCSISEYIKVKTKWNADCADDAGAPSKAQILQLVKIQHEERLAATSELNPTPSLVTD